MLLGLNKILAAKNIKKPAMDKMTNFQVSILRRKARVNSPIEYAVKSRDFS
jgi:hypothetical protein